jgi:serine protease Do
VPAGSGEEAAPTSDEIVPGVHANSIVEIIAYCANGSGAGGSGTVFIDGNHVLTNAHVLRPDSDGRSDGCTADDIEVRMISSIDRPTTITHRATIAATDERADLAILRVEPIGAGTVSLKPVRLGASPSAGDDLNIIGFPAIGGQTVTVSKGVVSGFVTIEGTRWIKTDASVSGGNSGGGAFARDGSLIGIPTQASRAEDGTIVDCRKIADTNDDGSIDDDDTCVPIGGFLNLLATMEEALALAKSIGLTP